MGQEQEMLRIGVLWRGDRQAEATLPRTDRGLGPLYDAFRQLPVVIEPVPYSDDAIDEVRVQLLTLDGVLVWVNPIQDGANRALLDPLLREASSKGVWVSAHPEVILQMGTKEILYRTRHLGWGSDTSLYRSAAEFASGFPDRLGQLGRLVIKQGRGNGGNGVWKAELPEGKPAPAAPDTVVRVQDARSKDGSAELLALGSFMQRCADYFTWSGCLVDQEYQDRLADGMLRCYFSGGQLVGFCQQWPKGLLDDDPHHDAPPASAMQGIRPQELPVIWDADFLYGPKTAAGEDTYVLCEINVSAVWPFPPMAAPTVAATALDRTQAMRTLHSTAPDDAGSSPNR